MSIIYMGKHRLCDGFEIRDMWNYVVETRQKLAAPLLPPAYVDEEEAQRIGAISQKFLKEPYAQRVDFNQSIMEIEMNVDNKPVSFAQFPRLYLICEFATKTLCYDGCRPIIQTYRAGEGDTDSAYGAYASCYLDNIRIYFSERLFQENRMLENAELCYLVGHELGHARCYHRTRILLSGRSIGIGKEYSADRAGLLVAALWMQKEQPDRPVADNVSAALMYCIAALQKAMYADELNLRGLSGLNEWSKFDYGELMKNMENARRNASQLGADYSTHPSNQRRYLAMKLFSESEKLYRCMDLAPSDYPGLHTDEHLRDQMYFLIRGGQPDDAK